jgi:biopolymer transport protein ExbD
MRRRAFHPAHPFGKINVTPMIDVVMCLIVFYLIVGKLAADQRANIRLPVSATGVTDKAQDQLIINILPGPPSAPPRVVIDAAEVPPEALLATIRERVASKPGLVVELRGSRELAYGAVAMVVRACKDAGVESVRLATERPEGAPGGMP